MGNNLDCSCGQRKETEKEVYYTNREISLNVNEFMPCKAMTIKLREKVIVDTTVQNEVDVGDDYNDEEELMQDEDRDRKGMVVKAGRKRSVNISGNDDEKKHSDDDDDVNNESHMKNDNGNNKDENNVNINNNMNSYNDNNACIDNDNINININEMNKITEETPNLPINKIETPVNNNNNTVNNYENNTPIIEEAPINNDNTTNINNNEQHKENISNINISNIAINDEPLHNENEISNNINKPPNILQQSPTTSENLQNNNITNNDDQANNSIPKLRLESDDLTLGLLLNSIDHQEEDQTEHLEATIHPPLTPLKHQPNRARSSSVDVITLNEDKLSRITKQINSLMQQAHRKPSIPSLIQKQQSTTSNNKPQTSRNNKHFNTHSHLQNSKHSQKQRSRTSRQSFTFLQHHFTCNKKCNCNCHLLYPSTGSGASLEKRINGQIINTSHSEALLNNV